MSLDVEINSNGYSLVGDKSNTKVSTRPVQQFVQPIRQTGRTRPEDTAQYESFVIPNLMNGFGRNKISSDMAFDPEEYKRFWNSTSETRFETIYLPLLSTTASHTGLERIRVSAEFKGTLFALFEDTTGHEISCAKFDSDDDPQWEEAGEVENLHSHGGYVSNSATASATSGTTETVDVATAGEDRYLLLFVGTRKTDSHVTTNSATYGGVSMSKLRTAGTDGTDDNIVTVFGLADPATGTNTAEATFSAAINTGSGGRATVIAVALNNVSSVVTGGTSNSDSNATTTSTSAITVTIGDVGFDMAFISTGTPAAGTGGTSVRSGTQARVTRNYSPDTSLTQVQTFSSASFAHAVQTVRFKGGLMPLDLAVSGPNLVALFLANDEYHVSISTDGATWTGSSTGQIGSSHVLLNSVTAGESIDAGKLMEIGGELVAAIWDETNSKIVFFSSTDNGDNWSAENDSGGSAVNIYSTSGVKGLAVMTGTDGEQKLYIGTETGLYECDTAPTNWTIEHVDKMSGSADNCRDMIVHQGSLWYPVGADTNTAAGMRKLTNTTNTKNLEVGFGLDFGDGVPSDLLGSFKRLVSAGEFLFASVGGSAADRNARILCWNNKGWHHIARSATANREIQWLDISSADDGSIGTPLLHYNISTGTSTSTSHYIEYPLTNPTSGVALKREDHSAGQSGTIDLPFFDLGIPQENKNFLAAHVIADDLDSATGSDKEYINVDYGLDNAALTTDLGDITSATSKLPFASGAGVSAKNLGLRLNINRSDTNTGTPKLRDIVVEGYVSPETFYEHQMVVDIDQSASETGQSIETVISNLETLINSVAQTSFKFGAVDKFVAVDRERSSFSYGLKTWEAGGPNSLAERSGLCTLTLIEKVAS
tara:strand:- start:901 stop:3543 length:2643 start_codon:yes stop_codon:yes gene_type:complete